MIQFVGNIDAKMDSKQRVFLPVCFRKLLPEEGQNVLIMRRDIYANCLVLYTQESWEEQVNNLKSKINWWDRDAKNLLRNFVDEAARIEIDHTGRILIPRKYTLAAGIESELIFLGVLNTIEIWSPKEYEKTKMEPDQLGASIQKLLGDNHSHD